MKYKNMTEQEWIEIGKQAKQVQQELSKLLKLSSGNMPVKIVSEIKKANNNINTFKSQAEDRMLQTKGSHRLDIFYGGKDE